MRKMFIVLTLLAMSLVSCSQEKKLRSDLAACQGFTVYLLCLNEQSEEFCNQKLCEQFPNAVVCDD